MARGDWVPGVREPWGYKPRPCEVCGEAIPPVQGRWGPQAPRADKRTCSPACRQKAYRARVAAERAAARGFAEQFPGLAAEVPQERPRRGSGGRGPGGRRRGDPGAI